MVLCDQPTSEQQLHLCTESVLLFLPAALHHADQYHVLWHPDRPVGADHGTGYIFITDECTLRKRPACYNSDKIPLYCLCGFLFMITGQFEFTWQQFMIGVESSLIMFPVNFLIVTIFRQTRPREMSCCKRKTGKADAGEVESTSQTPPSQTATTNMNDTVTLDSIINVGASRFHVLGSYFKCLQMPHIGRVGDMFKIMKDV